MVVATNREVLMTFWRSLLTSSRVQIPSALKYLTSPYVRKIAVARYNQYLNELQYNVSDNAAAVDTEASPNITKTTDGKQHMEASNADDEIHFHKVLSIYVALSVH